MEHKNNNHLQSADKLLYRETLLTKQIYWGSLTI